MSVVHSVGQSPYTPVAIIFDKSKYPWGEIRCMKWLIKHDMIPIKFDINNERIRARIIDPEELYKLKAQFRTIEIDHKKGIQFIIAYLPEKNKVQYKNI